MDQVAPGVKASEMVEGLRDRGREPPGPAAPVGLASAERCWRHHEELDSVIGDQPGTGGAPGARVPVLTQRKRQGN